MTRLLALARGDVLERVRRPAFLLTLALTAFAAHGALPPRGAPYATLQIGPHRPLYDSAGVGVVVALLTALFLSMFGFYLVRGAVTRDRVSGVGELLGAAPLSRARYATAKWLSNLAVLALIAAVMVVGSVVMQLARGEDAHVRPLVLLAPFVWLTLPALMVVSAAALVFEMVPALRGTLGNVVWFFLFGVVMAALVPDGRPTALGDPMGLHAVRPSLEASCLRAFPADSARVREVSAGVSISPGARTVTPFRWEGLPTGARWRAARGAWVVVALALVMLAAALFDRFEHGRAPGRARAPRAVASSAAAASASAAPAPVSLAALGPPARAARLAPLVRAQLALVFRDLPVAWGLVALGLAIACALAPLAVVRAWLLPVAMIWPLRAWSALGVRGSRSGVEALLLSAPRPLRRQLPAEWLAGVALTAAVAAPYLVRVALAGEGTALLGAVAGVLFVPALALAAGVWSGGPTLFEAVYLLLWYAGPLEHVPALDLFGAVPSAHAAHAVFLALAPALLALAAAGRARRLRR